MEDANKPRRIFLSLSNFWWDTQEINSWEKLAYIDISAKWNKRDKVWKNANYVFANVSVVDAKAILKQCL